jgi:hypothetical protein
MSDQYEFIINDKRKDKGVTLRRIAAGIGHPQTFECQGLSATEGVD